MPDDDETTHSTRILVYCDAGVSPVSLKQIMRRLKDHPAKRVKSSDLLSHLKEASLLIMPGGRDIPYHEALKGKPNQAIRQFVEEGGSYLGLCAGGYFGSALAEFEKGYPLEVIGSRELAFFPGKAIGPAYGSGMFQYDSEQGSRIAQLDWNGKRIGVYYNGGCYFSGDHPNTKVLARYADIASTPPAIIECQVGRGRAILSGVHPEYDRRLPNGGLIKHWDESLFPTILNKLLYNQTASAS